MNVEELKSRDLEKDFIFSASRSSGPGGQNVNKVSSKIELRFNVLLSTAFTDEEKELINRKLKNKITKDGELVLVSQSERTQLMNKIVVIEKFYIIVSNALMVQKKRRSTKPTLSSKIRRLEGKRNRSNIKKLRRDSGQSES